eukprot:989677-Alexandrium_andersonii.AAC.1
MLPREEVRTSDVHIRRLEHIDRLDEAVVLQDLATVNRPAQIHFSELGDQPDVVSAIDIRKDPEH